MMTQSLTYLWNAGMMMSKNELPKVSVRLVDDPPLVSNEPVRSYREAIALIEKELATFDREVFCILNLTQHNKPINFSIVSMGGLEQALVDPREVFKTAILSNASSFICFHNHVQGFPTPSKEDIAFTERLYHVCTLMGIKLKDHIIVGDNLDYSLKDNGDLREIQRRVDTAEFRRKLDIEKIHKINKPR